MLEGNKEFGATQILKTNCLLSSIPQKGEKYIKEDSDNEPEDNFVDNLQQEEIKDIKTYIKNAGLDSDYLELFLPELKQQIKSKVLFNVDIKKTDKKPSLLSLYNREKILQRLQQEEIYNLETDQKIKEKEEQKKNVLLLKEEINNKHKKLEIIKDSLEHITPLFIGNAKAQLELELNKIYSINVFRVIKNFIIIHTTLEEK